MLRGVVSPETSKSLSRTYSIDQELVENIDYGLIFDFDPPGFFQSLRGRVTRILKRLTPTKRKKELPKST
jgi:hypothetical protein